MLCSIEEVQAYLDDRLHTEPWDEATTDDKTKAIKMASRDIAQLPLLDKTVLEINIPQLVKDACAELTLSYLDDLSLEKELAALQNTSQGFSSVRSSYDRTFVPLHLQYGIMSARAFSFLKIYIDFSNEVKVSRV